MDFNRTSSNKRRAFTLAEMPIVMGLGSLVFLAVSTLSLHSGRSSVAILQYCDLDAHSRVALDRVSRDIRTMEAMASYSSSTIKNINTGQDETVISEIVLKPATASPSSEWIKYRYKPVAKTFVRQVGTGAEEVLLSECDYFRFDVYQRNVTPGTFIPIATSDAALAKQIRLDWVCSRTIFGNIRLFTESVQSAKFVMRRP